MKSPPQPDRFADLPDWARINQFMEKRYVGPVAYVPKGDRGFWFVLWNGRRLYCHISNYSELEPPKVRHLLSFELGPATRPEFGIQAIKIRPAPKEELNAGIDALNKVGA